ncbi:MAG: GNAT family N-acetyltransferase [Chloroflexi bacterium]|nr:GNAT family N-acetyltransferase [Ardenticatenaceae bacterium]MBL1129507.1 GNAT family N-acetyltransferase [Chloroflexota bacterium]NOG35589.1 GNAT family N-acetyltransferase [Chloroflexota bacterium]GIK58722.1 MAG: N-acetyltransferase [Chloroflexota bacterium]
MQITPATLLDFTVARPEDLPLVMEILAEAAAWLKQKGIDQWPSPPNEHWQRRMAEAIQREEVYTVGIVKNRFGIVRFTWADPYWPDDNLAGYVHSIAVRSEMHGQNLGGLILFWAMMKTKQEGRQFLRLDCLAGNGRLRRYYEDQGFSYQGEIIDQDYLAALYEREIG